MKANNAKKLTIPIVITVILIALVSTGLYISSQIEVYTTMEPVSTPYIVKVNPYLAAEYLLKKQNKHVSNKTNLFILKTLPNEKQTIFLPNSSEPLDASQSRQLLTWVSHGGYLIIEASSNNKVLNLLNVRLTRQKITTNTPKDDLLTRLYIEDGSEPALLSFESELHLEDPRNNAYTWANSNNGTTHMLQLRHNQGLVTVISDANIWKNDNINKYDHAWLLDYLTADRDVTIITLKPIPSSKNSQSTEKKLSQEKPSLLIALLQHFNYTLAFLALFILLLLWYKGTRHGPIEKAVSRDRRHLPEYLNASAKFLVKLFGQQELLSSLQQDIRYRAKKHHMGFEKLGLENQWEILSRLSNKPSEIISKCMRPLPPKKRLSNLEFIKLIVMLQDIRNTI